MPLTISDVDLVRGLVREHAAIDLDRDKAYLIEARLGSLARQEGLASAEALIAHLRAEPRGDLRRKAVEALTTNETLFFRDHHPFEALRTSVLPDLIRRRAGTRRLSIWCGACSSGQEPYSLAMLLREHFGGLPGWQVSLLATDISTEMVARARRGRYSQLEVNRGLPRNYLASYFRQHGHSWQIVEEVRRMVDYRVLNLIDTWPGLPPMDMILLRNVMIYFGIETRKTLLRRVATLLRPDGYLFLGGSETPYNLVDLFERVEFAQVGCYRLRQPVIETRVTPGLVRCRPGSVGP